MTAVIMAALLIVGAMIDGCRMVYRHAVRDTAADIVTVHKTGGGVVVIRI